MSRKIGLASDLLKSVRLISANGKVLNVGADDDIFRALVGSGSTFGVVTSLTFQALELSDLHAVESMEWNVSEKRISQVICDFGKYCEKAKVHVTLFARLNKNVFRVFQIVKQGDESYFWRPTLPPVKHERERVDLHSLSHVLDDLYPEGLRRFFSRSTLLKRKRGNLNKKFVTKLLYFLQQKENIGDTFLLDIDIFQLGGAISTIKSSGIALPHSHALFEVHATCTSTEGLQVSTSASKVVRRFNKLLGALRLKCGSYLGTDSLMVERASRAKSEFGQDFKKHLVCSGKIKSKFDPENNFRNILDYYDMNVSSLARWNVYLWPSTKQVLASPVHLRKCGLSIFIILNDH